MNKNKRDFFNGCFPSNWVEVEPKVEKREQQTNSYQRKDVATLLAELEDIKNAFERIEEKKIRLQNLMMFYRGDLIATE